MAVEFEFRNGKVLGLKWSHRAEFPTHRKLLRSPTCVSLVFPLLKITGKGERFNRVLNKFKYHVR